MPSGAGFARLEARVGDRIEFLVIDTPLARAFFHGIPAARLLARARPAGRRQNADAAWDAHLRSLLQGDPAAYEAVKRAAARHARVAHDEGPLEASEATIAVLVWAVASAPETDASLVEIAPAAGQASACEPSVLRACSMYDDRLSDAAADKRAPAFEACARLAKLDAIRPRPAGWVRATAAQLERSEIGIRLLGDAPSSIFPRRVDDEIAPGDRRMVAISRGPLDALAALEPRQLGAVIARMEEASRGAGADVATFLADLTHLLSHEGTLVAVIAPPGLPDAEDAAASEAPASWTPADWTSSTAAAVAEALECGRTTLSRVRAAAARGGEAALDAIGAEMLLIGGHAMASAAFAEILSSRMRRATSCASWPSLRDRARPRCARCQGAQRVHRGRAPARARGMARRDAAARRRRCARLGRGEGERVHRIAQAVSAALQRGQAPADASRPERGGLHQMRVGRTAEIRGTADARFTAIPYDESLLHERRVLHWRRASSGGEAHLRLEGGATDGLPRDEVVGPDGVPRHRRGEAVAPGGLRWPYPGPYPRYRVERERPAVPRSKP